MKLPLRLLALLALAFLAARAESLAPAEAELAAFQQKLDDAVVAADVTWLQGAFTDDFYFKHGTGSVDNKASWLASVAKNQGKFVSRQHSDVQVDLHGDIGVTHGKLRVTRADQAYAVDYVRVYVRRDGRWQLLSHRTVQEEHFGAPPANTPPRINHIAFYVADLKISTDFYTNTVGLTPIPEPFHDGRHSWFSVGPKTHLHIISGATVKLPKEKNAHLCFTVPSVEAFIPRLNAAGITYENWAGQKSAVTKRVDGVQQIYFQDPDGYWIEINDARE